MTALERMARRARWHVVAAAVAVLLASAVFTGLSLTRHPVPQGSGPAGTPVAVTGPLSARATVSVYGLPRPPGEFLDCRVQGEAGFFTEYGFPTATFEGRQWVRLGSTSARIRAGDEITCPAQGITEVYLVEEASARYGVLAVALGVGGLFLGAFAVVLVLVTRRGSRFS